MVHVWTNKSHDSGSGMTRTLFFVVFMGNCYGFSMCSLNAKPVWINVASEKSFHSLRSLSRTMEAVNPTRVIRSVTLLESR